MRVLVVEDETKVGSFIKARALEEEVMPSTSARTARRVSTRL